MKFLQHTQKKKIQDRNIMHLVVEIHVQCEVGDLYVFVNCFCVLNTSITPYSQILFTLLVFFLHKMHKFFPSRSPF